VNEELFLLPWLPWPPPLALDRGLLNGLPGAENGCIMLTLDRLEGAGEVGEEEIGDASIASVCTDKCQRNSWKMEGGECGGGGGMLGRANGPCGQL